MFCWYWRKWSQTWSWSWAQNWWIRCLVISFKSVGNEINTRGQLCVLHLDSAVAGAGVKTDVEERSCSFWSFPSSRRWCSEGWTIWQARRCDNTRKEEWYEWDVLAAEGVHVWSLWNVTLIWKSCFTRLSRDLKSDWWLFPFKMDCFVGDHVAEIGAGSPARMLECSPTVALNG